MKEKNPRSGITSKNGQDANKPLDLDQNPIDIVFTVTQQKINWKPSNGRRQENEML